jgi:NAD+ diphosphatase
VRHYLGRLDGLDCWALKLQAVPEGWRPVPLRAAMMGFPESLAGLASRAAQVLDWDRSAPLLRRLRHAHRAAAG